jgi:two-component system cell cycle sensor histidine kinase/response regulator CckA
MGSLRVLIAEDSEDDALLLIRELQRGGYDPEYVRVATADAMTAALDRQAWDLVLSDHSMPHFSGMAALALLRDRGLDVPFISVSGTSSEQEAVVAMKAGANDYVAKGRLNRLLPAIERELREAKGREARRALEAAIRLSEASYAALVEHAPIGIYRSTPEGQFLSANDTFARMLGYQSTDEVLSLDMARDVYVDPAERTRLLDEAAATDRIHHDAEATWKRGDGRRITVQLRARAVLDERGRVNYYEAFAWDVTEQRRLQTHVAQAHKMEAIGRLAGGIAHDFNNLLTVITSYGDVLLDTLARDDPNREDVEQIRQAADAAASLTRQLLAFSRQQVVAPQVVDLNGVVSGFRKMLTRIIGEDIECVTLLSPQGCAVRADVGQLEQVLMNLAVNARDAMPTGGTLTIETASVHVDPDTRDAHPTGVAGRFTILTVRDTGVGMDDATKARIFEPFFTTKPAGQGTGLGLATVYGILQQSGGFVEVDSQLGRGTAFRIYLPHVGIVERRDPSPTTDARGGAETTL